MKTFEVDVPIRLVKDASVHQQYSLILMTRIYFQIAKELQTTIVDFEPLGSSSPQVARNSCHSLMI